MEKHYKSLTTQSISQKNLIFSFTSTTTCCIYTASRRKGPYCLFVFTHNLVKLQQMLTHFALAHKQEIQLLNASAISQLTSSLLTLQRIVISRGRKLTRSRDCRVSGDTTFSRDNEILTKNFHLIKSHSATKLFPGHSVHESSSLVFQEQLSICQRVVSLRYWSASNLLQFNVNATYSLVQKELQCGLATMTVYQLTDRRLYCCCPVICLRSDFCSRCRWWHWTVTRITFSHARDV